MEKKPKKKYNDNYMYTNYASDTDTNGGGGYKQRPGQVSMGAGDTWTVVNNQQMGDGQWMGGKQVLMSCLVQNFGFQKNQKPLYYDTLRLLVMVQ